MKEPTIRENGKMFPKGPLTHFVIHDQQTVNQNRPNDRW